MVRFEPYPLSPEAMERASRLRSEIAGNQMLMSCYRLGLLLRKQNFDPNEPRVPAGNPDGGQWTSGGGNGAGRSATSDGGDDGANGEARVIEAAQRSGLIQWEKNSESAFWATPSFVARFAGSPEEVRVTSTVLLIDAGGYPVYKQLSGSILQLPGGRSATYDVYTVGPPQRSSPGIERIAHLPGSNVYYYAPNHYDPAPGVPNGWVKMTYPISQARRT